jgi:hypothetical protein
MRIHFKPPDRSILCGAKIARHGRPNYSYRLKAVNCPKCLELQKAEWEAKLKARSSK